MSAELEKNLWKIREIVLVFLRKDQTEDHFFNAWVLCGMNKNQKLKDEKAYIYGIL